MEDELIRHRIKDILVDQIRMQGGKKKKRSMSKTPRKKMAGSKISRKKVSKSKTHRVRGNARKATSPWIAYVKKYAKMHGMTYGEALKKAGPSYRREYGGVSAGRRKKSKSKSHIVRKRRTVRKAGVLVGGRKRRIHKTRRAGALVAGSKTTRRRRHKRPA